MLSINHNSKIFIYQEPINMKKSFEGLTTAIELTFHGKLFSNSYFVFANRKKNHVKILYWDEDGFAIWYKRLEKGAFIFTNKSSFTRQEFFMFLEGITPKKINHRYRKKY